jgi:hypothetical protein
MFVSEDGEKIDFTLKGWGLLLHMAENFGWQPAGTNAPKREFPPQKVWDGNYYAKAGQFVTSEDARALAACLAKGLLDLGDQETTSKAWERTFTTSEEWRTFRPTLSDALTFFSGPGKQKVQNFIDFCRKGGFSIYYYN